MSKGSPDYTSPVRIQGLYGTTLKTVAVDASGQLYALLKGRYGEVYVPLSLDSHGYITAILKGTDGTILRSVLTDTSGRVINVLRDPTSNNYVSVDTNGFITAVLKGWDGEALQSIKVDAAGRGIMVLRDPSSDNYAAINAAGQLQAVMLGQYEATSKIILTDSVGRMMAILVDPPNVRGVRAVVGSGELAARLGSSVFYERRGTVAFMDSFEYGLSRGAATVGGESAAATLSAYVCRSKGYSLKMVTGAAENDFAGWTSDVALPTYNGKLGFEVHFHTEQEDGYFLIFVRTYDGTNYYDFRIKWDLNDGKLYYYSSGQAYVDTEVAITPTTAGAVFIPTKLIIDNSTHKYVGLYIEDRLIDLTDIVAFTGSSEVNPVLQYQCYLQADADSGVITGYLDNIVVTVAEESVV